MTHLMACETCARHVRASEEACPFCGVAIAASIRESSPRRGPAGRLSRAGLVALGVGVIAVPIGMAGCAESAQMAVYGGPPPELLDAPDGGHADAAPAPPLVKPAPSAAQK